MYDLVFNGGTLVTPSGVQRGDLAIQDGRIAGIGSGLEGVRRIDASGLLVIPGGVDPHVHLEMPSGQTVSSDDWDTGPLAAAFGGTTTLISFVEPEPWETLLEALSRRRASAHGRSSVDYSFHMTITSASPESLSQLKDCMAAGVTSFKMYTTYEGFRMDYAELRTALSAMGELRALPLIHSEDDRIVHDEKQRMLASSPADPASHAASRPALAESRAIKSVLELAQRAPAAVYIVHVSTAEGAQAIRDARELGVPAYGETCPQYLLLTEAEYQQPGFEGAKFVCSPPLRGPNHAATLWQALKDDSLQVVATDHCPFFYQSQKSIGQHQFDAIPAGLPGVESRLRLVYSFGVAAGRLGLGQWVRICCTNPAHLFGLFPRKGVLARGADADIVLFDPRAHGTISHRDLHEHVDYTPYEGMPVEGEVRSVFKAGRMLVHEGKLVGQAGTGRFLPRAVSSGVPAHAG